MSSSGFTRGEELLRARNRDQSLLPSGEKVEEAVGSWLEEKMVESCLQEHHALLKEPKVARKDQLATGEWLLESQMVKVTRPGKFWHHMGVETDIGKCLYPEEAVYLIDTGELEVMHNGLPLSLQQAQAMLLQDAHHMEQYLVYSHLTRTGCKVVRHQTHLVFTKYEKEIRIDQHQTSRKGVKLKLRSDKDSLDDNSPKKDSNPQPVDSALEELYACLGEAAVNPMALGKDGASSSVKLVTATSKDKEEDTIKKAPGCDKEVPSPHEIRRRELIELFPNMVGREVMYVDVEPVELFPKNSIPSKKTYRISVEALEYFSVYETRHHYHYQSDNQTYRNWNKQDSWNCSRNGRWGSSADSFNWRSQDGSFPSQGSGGFRERDNRWQQHSQSQRDSHAMWREDRNGRWGSGNDSNWRYHSDSESDMGYKDRHSDSGHNMGLRNRPSDHPHPQPQGDDIDYTVWPEWKRKRRRPCRQQGRDTYPSALVKLRTKVTSWKEYKCVVAEMNAKKQLMKSGTRVLWEGRTTPLLVSHANSLPASSSTLLSSCSLDAQVLNVNAFRDIIPQEAQLKVLYDVYLPSVAYKKSDPPAPSKRVVLVRDGAMPSPGQILEVSNRFSDDVAVVCVVVTGGEVRLYTFSSLVLPPPQPFTS